MNRRSFLQRGVLATTALTLGGTTATRSAAAEQAAEGVASTARVRDRVAGAKLKLSCAAYSFRQQLGGENPSLTLDEFIDFCARQKLEATELTSYYFRDTRPEYLLSLRRRAYVNGLAISGTPVGNNFCAPSGPQRDKAIAHVRQWIDNVALLGSHTIRVFAGSAPKAVKEDEASTWAVECFREVAEYAGKRGVLLALENHGGITATADQLLELVRSVDSPWFGVNLDTGNFSDADPYTAMEKAAPYAVSVQLKVAVRVPGRGKVPTDIPRVVKILQRAGYRGYVALEYEEGENPFEAVPRYLKQLRDAIG